MGYYETDLLWGWEIVFKNMLSFSERGQFPKCKCGHDYIDTNRKAKQGGTAMKLSRLIGIWSFLVFGFFPSICHGAESASLYKTYDLPFQPRVWYFSPFHTGRIWLSNGNGIAQEFDPASGKCSPLTDLLGDFATGLADMVFVDAYNPHLIWISNFHKGLMAYHQPTRKAVKYLQQKYFKDAALMDILPAKDSVWIATSDGLYRLNRADWKIEAVVQTRGKWVSNMRLVGKDEILFSGGTHSPDDSIRYRYRIASNQLEKLPFQARPDPVRDILATVKAGTGLNAKTINDIWDDGGLVWFVDDLGLGRIQKKNGRIVYLDLGWVWSRWPRALLPGKSAIWVLCGKKLLAVDKYPPAALITDAASLKTRQQNIFAMESAIIYEKNGIVLFQKVVQLLDLIDHYRQGSSERERLFHDVMITMHKHGMENIPLLEEYLQGKAVDPAVTPYVLFGLLCAHSLAGDPGQSLQYYDRLATEYPSSEIFGWIPAENIEALKKGKAELERIKTNRLSPDQRLWELGQAYAAMMRVAWNSVEMGFDMSLPLSYFSRIIDFYPRSTYADNAWWVLNLSEGDWEGIYGMYFLDTMLPKYNDFLTRYPSSEWVPRAKYSISWAMFNAVEYAENQPEDRDKLPFEKFREYLVTARKMCSEAIREGLLENDAEGYPPPKETLDRIEKYVQKYSGKPEK